jgi:hypothetical protein
MSDGYIIHKLSLPLFLNKNILCRNSISYWNGENDAAHKAVGKANAQKRSARMQMMLSAYCANENLEILRGTHKKLQAQLGLQSTGIISLSMKLFSSSFCGLVYDYRGRAV